MNCQACSRLTGLQAKTAGVSNGEESNLQRGRKGKRGAVVSCKLCFLSPTQVMLVGAADRDTERKIQVVDGGWSVV